MEHVPTVLILASIRILLSKLDKARRLIEIAEKERESSRSSLLQPLSRGLQVPERLSIESAVKKFHSDRLNRVIELINEDHTRDPEIQESDPSANHYPISEEQAHIVISRYIDKVDTSIWTELTHLYEEKDTHLNYAAAFYLTLSQPALEQVLAESLLPTVLQAFEEFLGSLVRTAAFFGGAESLGDLPPVPSHVILSYGRNVATADLERWMIDRRVEAFVESGYSGWREDIRRWSKFDIENAGANWPVIIEGIARARLLKRNSSGLMDAAYQSDVGGSRNPSDSPSLRSLTTTPEYFGLLADEIETGALTVGLRWGQHFFPNPDAEISLVIDRMVKLESRRRWTQVLTIAETLLDTFVHSDHTSFGITKVNQWYCSQEIGADDDKMHRAIAQFTPKDVAESIGIAAITRDWPELADGIKRYEVKYGKDSLKNLAAMPLVRRAVREYNPLRSMLFDDGTTRRKRGRRK